MGVDARALTRQDAAVILAAQAEATHTMAAEAAADLITEAVEGMGAGVDMVVAATAAALVAGAVDISRFSL